MRCVICDATDKWKNVDQYRLAPADMCMCEGCGFVSYPKRHASEADIKDYYKLDYRPAPNVNNAHTGQRKLNIHAHFLAKTFEMWKQQKREKIVVSEIGAAYGMFLDWVRSVFPEAELNGTEYALAYRRNAFHEYGIRLDVDFDKSKKYDLISSFKVAEHQMDVDLRLREYVECLKDDGFLYISVPTWFGRMTNFGREGFDLEYYYHKDHINVWTENLFETLLTKVGLKVISKDKWMYDETYLCVRDDKVMELPQVYEDPKSVEKRLDSIKKAYMLYMENRLDEAVNVYPNFPTAWMTRYEKHRALAHKHGQAEEPFDYAWKNYVAPAIKSCQYSLDVNRLATDVYMRYDRFEAAIELINKMLEVRPNNPAFVMSMSHCLRQIGLRTKNAALRKKFLTEARDCCRYLRGVDLQSKAEATNWIYQDNALLQTPFEEVEHAKS